jgi:hypothetical protein
MKDGLELNVDTLEFSPTKIIEELIDECDVKIEKFAPSIYFTEEINTNDLKLKLKYKLYESDIFSNFINTIKDEYRALEVMDSLLYKKNPKAYEDAKQKEHEEHQKELWEEYTKQIEDKKKKREDYLISYNNDLKKLLQEYFESSIEFEKRDFNFSKEIDNLLNNLIDNEKWIKVNDKPLTCINDVVSIKNDSLDMFFTDNNDYSFTAKLRFDKTSLITENIKKISDKNDIPNILKDYEALIQLYDIDVNIFQDWMFKNETDKFNNVIDHLSSLFKTKKEEEQKRLIESIIDEESNGNKKNI